MELRRKGYPAPPGLHAQRGAQHGDHFEDHRRGSRGCRACGSTRPLEESSSRWSTTGAIRADGPRLFTGSPPAQPTSRSGRGMDGIKHVLGIWAPGPRREPPSRAARVRSCWHNRSVGACLIVEGAPPARERSARRNVTGSPAFPRRTQAVLAPGHGPHLCGPPDPLLDAVRLLRGPPEGRGRSQGRSAPPRTRRPPGRL